MDSLVSGELQQADKNGGNIEMKDARIITEDDVDILLGHSFYAFADEQTRLLCKKYLLKSYNKTASLMANSCKSVAMLACKFQNVDLEDHEAIADAAFGFGRDIGICFQIVDDALDFEAEEEVLGKPVAADLK